MSKIQHYNLLIKS